MWSSKGKEKVRSWGRWPPCAACQQLGRVCEEDCVFATHFPSDDDPAWFVTVTVLAAFGADNAVGFLGSLPQDQRANAARLLAIDASLLLDPGERPPCAACMHLQRTCVFGCVFAPHFKHDDDRNTFASVVSTFSPDDVAELLHSLPTDKQADTVRTLVLLGQQPSTSARPVVPPARTQLGERRPPCAACKQFHRRCETNCVFAPCFPGPGVPEAEDAGLTGALSNVSMLAQQQVEKMEKVVGSAVGDAMALAQDGAKRGLQIAVEHAWDDDDLEALTQPLLTCTADLTPAPPSTPAPAVSTDTAVDTTLTMPREEDDDTWNKRQIGYVLVLSTTVALVFMMRPFLPDAYVRLIIFVIAAVWGLGSVGLPNGLYGTSRREKEFSRHVGRLIHAFFSVLVIYGFYLLAMHFDDSSASAPSASPSEAPTYGNYEFWWTIGFALVGAFVLAGIVHSWIRGCRNGVDRDRYP